MVFLLVSKFLRASYRIAASRHKCAPLAWVSRRNFRVLLTEVKEDVRLEFAASAPRLEFRQFCSVEYRFGRFSGGGRHHSCLSDVTLLTYDDGNSSADRLTFPPRTVLVGKSGLGNDFRRATAVIFRFLRIRSVSAGGKDKSKSQENAHHIQTQTAHNAMCFFPQFQ